MGHPQPIRIKITKKCPKLLGIYGIVTALACLSVCMQAEGLPRDTYEDLCVAQFASVPNYWEFTVVTALACLSACRPRVGLPQDTYEDLCVEQFASVPNY